LSARQQKPCCLEDIDYLQTKLASLSDKVNNYITQQKALQNRKPDTKIEETKIEPPPTPPQPTEQEKFQLWKLGQLPKSHSKDKNDPEPLFAHLSTNREDVLSDMEEESVESDEK